jgi:hypothetical protein
MANFTHKIEAQGKWATYPMHWDADRIINDFAKRAFDMPFRGFIIERETVQTWPAVEYSLEGEGSGDWSEGKDWQPGRFRIIGIEEQGEV